MLVVVVALNMRRTITKIILFNHKIFTCHRGWCDTIDVGAGSYVHGMCAPGERVHSMVRDYYCGRMFIRAGHVRLVGTRALGVIRPFVVETRLYIQGTCAPANACISLCETIKQGQSCRAQRSGERGPPEVRDYYYESSVIRVRSGEQVHSEV